MSEWIDLIQQFWRDLQQGQLPPLGIWNYFILSLLIVWQGPIATVLGGAAASAGLLKPWWVFVAGAVGNLVADIAWYTLGRRSNVERIVRFRRLQRHSRYLTRLVQVMRKHTVKILLVAKLSAGLAVPALLAAGLSRVDWKRWFPTVFIGESIWTGGLVLIGFYATEAFKRVEQGLHFILLGITLTLLVVFLWLIPRYLDNSEALKLSSTSRNENGTP